MSPGWWRRNRWGLILLLPLIAGLGAVESPTLYERLWGADQREPLAVEPAGWATFPRDGARVRLGGIDKVTDVEGLGAPGLTVSPAVGIWRAWIEIDKPAGSTVGGCVVTVEDDQGRTYEANPNEIRGSKVTQLGCVDSSAGSADNDPADNDPVASKARYDIAVYFALPTDARPVAVLVVLEGDLPRFARLPVG